MMRLQLLLLLLLCPGLAQAWSVAVVTDVQGGPLSDEAVQSALWHALRSDRGHDVLVLEDDLDAAHERMATEHLSTLLRFEVRWHSEARWLDGGILADEVPVIEVTEHRADLYGLTEVRRWKSTSGLAVYPASGEHTWTVMPEVMLQQAIDHAVRPVQPVTWFSERAPPVQLTVVLCPDDAWQTAHGSQWRQAARHRMDRAAKLLQQANLTLTISGWCAWSPAPDLTTLPELLADLSTLPLRDGSIRVGFTARPHRPALNPQADEVGRAYTPGRDLVVLDQGLIPGHDPDWDVAAEGSAIAHELLHTLGLPHQEDAHVLMNAVQRGSVHTLSPATRALALAAAEARYAHWDPVAALLSLSYAAELWMDDPELQVDFIRENLAQGPGVPHPGQVVPARVSALGSVALTRHWLSQPRLVETDKDLREPLLAHGQAAMDELPNLASPLVDALQQPVARPSAPTSPPPPVRLPHCGPGPATRDCPTE